MKVPRQIALLQRTYSLQKTLLGSPTTIIQRYTHPIYNQIAGLRVLQLLLAVFIGGGTGSVARWMLSMRFNPLHQAIPFGTLAANLLGAFIIGMGLAWFNRMTNIDQCGRY
jgi:hypothetical protein